MDDSVIRDFGLFALLIVVGPFLAAAALAPLVALWIFIRGTDR
jgi:hypothetical protein